MRVKDKRLIIIESLQRRATKYVLNDFKSNYKSRLIKLNLLPVSMQLELNDIYFFINTLKLISPNNSFDVSEFTSFSVNLTRSGSYRKLVQPFVKCNRDKQFYFNRLPYLWNSLPPIDLSLSLKCIKAKLVGIFWDTFLSQFNDGIQCTYYFACPCHSCFSKPKSCFTTM